MATRAQAKAAIDAVVAMVKTDIDSFLPSSVNIKDGGIRFGPGRWTIELLETNRAAALALSATIQSLLTAGGKTFTVNQSRRSTDAKFVAIRYEGNIFHIAF